MISFICIGEVSSKYILLKHSGYEFPNWDKLKNCYNCFHQYYDLFSMVQKQHRRLSLWTSDENIRKVSLDVQFFSIFPFYLKYSFIITQSKCHTLCLFFKINKSNLVVDCLFTSKKKSPRFKEKYSKFHIEVPYIDRDV